MEKKSSFPFPITRKSIVLPTSRLQRDFLLFHCNISLAFPLLGFLLEQVFLPLWLHARFPHRYVLFASWCTLLSRPDLSAHPPWPADGASLTRPVLSARCVYQAHWGQLSILFVFPFPFTIKSSVPEQYQMHVRCLIFVEWMHAAF